MHLLGANTAGSTARSLQLCPAHISHTTPALRSAIRCASNSTGPQNKGTNNNSSNRNSSRNKPLQESTNGPTTPVANSEATAPAPPPSLQHPSTAPSNWSNPNSSSSSSSRPGKKAVVVGGGWAGFGAALALAKAGADVTLLDAGDSPGGLSSAFRSSGGQVIEPGIKGFWYQYNNIEALVTELGIPDPFTPFTRSSFWSPQGLQVDSPIFQNLPRLPTPLGSFVHTAPLFTDLPLFDRATAAPLVKPLLEHDLSEEIYRHYDTMSAYELFRSAGVSKQLYDKFLAPMLLVTLFAPPTELSAAAALGALYYFALAHQADFDVRWCRGPIGQLIFEPLVHHLKTTLGVRVLGSRRVQDIQQIPQNPGTSNSTNPTLNPNSNNPGVVVAKGPEGGLVERYDADVIVLAAGVPALQRLVTQSKVLAGAGDLRAVLGVGCSDVLAVRLWLDQKLQLRSSSNVVAGFDDGAGGTFFHLNELQNQYKNEPGSVLEFDIYHAESLLPLSDDALITRLLHTYLAPALPRGLEQAQTLTVKDSSVLRFRNAVTRFSPGSHMQLPGIVTSIPNVFVAGDCVKQGPGTHGCKGLSQEKAYVSGLQAGNCAAARLGLRPVARVLPVEPDEPHVTAAKELLRFQQQLTTAVTGAAAAARRSTGAGRGSYTNGRSDIGVAGNGAQQLQQQQQKQVVASGSSSSSSSSRGWVDDGTDSERRARESHRLRQLLKEEVAEQVAQ